MRHGLTNTMESEEFMFYLVLHQKSKREDIEYAGKCRGERQREKVADAR